MLLENENLIILKKEEITRMHRLAMELFKAGHITWDDAIMMVTVAHRARPTGRHILSSLERLYKKSK